MTCSNPSATVRQAVSWSGQVVIGLPSVGRAWRSASSGSFRHAQSRTMTGTTRQAPAACRCRARRNSTSAQYVGGEEVRADQQDDHVGFL